MEENMILDGEFFDGGGWNQKSEHTLKSNEVGKKSSSAKSFFSPKKSYHISSPTRYPQPTTPRPFRFTWDGVFSCPPAPLPQAG